MKRFGRIVGWLLLFLAVFSFAYEIVNWWETDQYQVVALGQMIFDYWPGLLPNLQAGVQRYLHPTIWDPGIQTILLLPGWLVFGVPGLILVLLLRRPRRRKGMFRG